MFNIGKNDACKEWKAKVARLSCAPEFRAYDIKTPLSFLKDMSLASLKHHVYHFDILYVGLQQMPSISMMSRAVVRKCYISIATCIFAHFLSCQACSLC